MSDIQFETKKIYTNSEKNIISNSKENLKPINQNKEKINKNNKSIFFVNKLQTKEEKEKKVEKPKNLVNNKEKINSNNNNINTITNSNNNNLHETKNEIKENEQQNNITKNIIEKKEDIKNEKKDNFIVKKAEEIKPVENKEIKVIDNKNLNEKVNDSNISKTTITNNFIIKDNPFMINTNLTNSNLLTKENPYMMNPNIANSNIINTNVQNPIMNNNFNNNNFNIRGNFNPNNNNTNIINSINYDNNIISGMVYKDNNLNRNNNINMDKNNNNIINNIRFTRGQSFQPKYNSFLNNKHHLLENAIIKKEFQEPKRKVILKNEANSPSNIMSNSDPNNSECFNSFQKIINLEESDSENNYSDDYEDSQEYNEEDDEEYNLDTKDENWLNNCSRKKRGSSLYNSRTKDSESENPLYDELNSLIKKYDFDTIIECCLRIYNNEFNIKDKQIKDYDILKKINDILSKSNRETIHILLIKILSNNFNEYQNKLLSFISNNNVDTNKVFNSPIEIKENSREKCAKRGKIQKLAKNGEKLKEKRKHNKRPSPPFYYGKHFQRKNNKIYIYVPKAKTVSFNRYTLYCIYRGSKEKCMAKIIVHQNDNKITYIGSHVCNPRMTLDDFHRKYPNIKRNNWTHIQFAVRNGKPYMMSQR